MDGTRDEASGRASAAAGWAGERTLEIVDLLGRRLMIGLALAGGLPALAIYARAEPKHFEAFVAGGEVIRINQRTGTIVACNPTRCMQVLERGQRLQEHPKGGLFQSQAPSSATALPAPAASPAAPAKSGTAK